MKKKRVFDFAPWFITYSFKSKYQKDDCWQRAHFRNACWMSLQQTAMAKNIAAIDQRLTTLEERVDARLKETIWEAVQEQVQRLIERFDLMLHDLYEVRIDVRGHHRRLDELERRGPSEPDSLS